MKKNKKINCSIIEELAMNNYQSLIQKSNLKLIQIYALLNQITTCYLIFLILRLLWKNKILGLKDIKMQHTKDKSTNLLS